MAANDAIAEIYLYESRLLDRVAHHGKHTRRVSRISAAVDVGNIMVSMGTILAIGKRTFELKSSIASRKRQ